MTPRLLRSGLTGRVYVVTRYKQDGDNIVATTKYDVTDDFNALRKDEPSWTSSDASAGPSGPSFAATTAQRRSDPAATAPTVGRAADPVPEPTPGLRDDEIAQMFHETYERLAPDYGYRTRTASAVPWARVPQENRALMIATVHEVRAALHPKDGAS